MSKQKETAVAANMNLHVKRVHFGIAAPGSTLSFRIEPAEGFTVTAVLERDGKTVATWEWVELKNGERPEEPLIPAGTYTLTLTFVYIGSADATADIAFGLNSTLKTRKITGRKPDIGKAIAVVFIR